MGTWRNRGASGGLAGASSKFESRPQKRKPPPRRQLGAVCDRRSHLQMGPFSSADIIALYADHATHEQFHSEFKTDLDLTRLPSGKFDTNYLVCQLAAVAMNILRLIGQRGLLGPDAPVRHTAKRRRLKTVMQELIYRAGRLISTGRKLILGLGANDRSAKAFARLNGELFAAST